MKTKYNNAQGMELLITYSRNPSLALRNQLVELHTGLVRQVAHRISNQCTEPYEDLEQIGYLGLINAIERFNPHQGCAFSSFAIPYIRGEMLHYLRDKGSVMRIPRRWQELYNKGKKVRKQLTTSLGRTPKDQELADALQVSLEEWHECELALQNRMLVSLDSTINQNTDSTVSFGETLPDHRYQAKQSQEEDRLQLQRAMSQLEDKTKEAIECVFIKELPRKEAAKRIGMSPMTVTRHLHKGIKQLIILLESQVA
ncbi:RNA polymerase, sigma 28 subunit, FliA/WhiG subfamily [Rippkaea orientalis PCC 8801]|uniref:RNA polymerase, sigma 28 subunit, FliA/WhiG subfamily n=1 Tax=Rippkaea orientalis (strain PCC 8801 / RF-1) TaxID=41431 RepID=B7JXJ8_RIPO1|nr:RNA polymerase sigma factor SigF [Rippkaea orientalis]ACK64755.1 RNA polymerase, sigma 28 subunit, FliA/WhiG subfamily [Rippkaea orientalis PCC 8801]